MANIELNPIVRSFKGRVGNLVVYKVKDKTYVRSYVVPRNPDTEEQRENRALFADAVMAWQALSKEDKEYYNNLAIRRGKGRGYNLFLSMYMKGETGTLRGYVEPQCIAYLHDHALRSLSGVHKAFSFDATPLVVRYSRSIPGKSPICRDSACCISAYT